MCVVQVFDHDTMISNICSIATKKGFFIMNENSLTKRQIQILEFIDSESRERGFPPSVREICKAVGLTSPSTVHAHLSSLQKLGYLRRSDPGKPRAIEVCFDASSGAIAERRFPKCFVVVLLYSALDHRHVPPPSRLKPDPHTSEGA